MTPQEAIERLHKIPVRPKPDNALDMQALIIAVKAVEKQIPKKVKEVIRTACNSKTISEITEFNAYNPSDKKEVPEYKEYKYNDYLCPNCNALTKDGTPKYCWRCGQALDWSDDK